MTFALFFGAAPLVRMQCTKKGKTMQAAQRKTSAAVKIRTARPEFIAAVRYLDGRRDMFHVRNADDMADARALVLSELGDVRSLVMAVRQR